MYYNVCHIMLAYHKLGSGLITTGLNTVKSVGFSSNKFNTLCARTTLDD